MKKNKFETIFIILMLISIISAVLNILLFIIHNKITYIFISMISLFIVGVTVLVLTFKNDNEDYLNKYVVMDKDEFEQMKKTLFKQEREIKKLKTIIRNKQL